MQSLVSCNIGYECCTIMQSLRELDPRRNIVPENFAVKFFPDIGVENFPFITNHGEIQTCGFEVC